MIHFDRIINLLEKTEDVPIGFDPAIWRLVVRKVMVGKDSVRFIMAGDSETIIRIMKLWPLFWNFASAWWNFDSSHSETLGTPITILFMGYTETVRGLRFCQKPWNVAWNSSVKKCQSSETHLFQRKTKDYTLYQMRSPALAEDGGRIFQESLIWLRLRLCFSFWPTIDSLFFDSGPVVLLLWFYMFSIASFIWSMR